MSLHRVALVLLFRSMCGSCGTTGYIFYYSLELKGCFDVGSVLCLGSLFGMSCVFLPVYETGGK